MLQSCPSFFGLGKEEGQVHDPFHSFITQETINKQITTRARQGCNILLPRGGRSIDPLGTLCDQGGSIKASLACRPRSGGVWVAKERIVLVYNNNIIKGDRDGQATRMAAMHCSIQGKNG